MNPHDDFKEIFLAQIISITGGLIGGLILAFVTDKIELVPALFILVPGFLEMKNSNSGSLSARLSSGLFLDALKPKLKNQRLLRSNIIASFILVIIVSILLGIISYGIGYLIFGITSTKIIIIAFIAGILSNLIEIPLNVFFTFWIFRKGHDPNNIMGPYITTIGDIISFVCLYIAIVIV